jgi:Phosphoesterase family
LKNSRKLPDEITRREFTKIAGATAIISSIPGMAAAQAARLVADRQKALDHVVVVMFENRSFDNLLGRLYQPGDVKSFEGVIDKDLKNPIPEWAQNEANRKLVPYGIAANMNTPSPDSGEEYPHLNTDLFGILDPKNRFKTLAQMVAPYNAPDYPHQQPTMDGFVADYISTFTAEMRRAPTYDEYSQIMMGYSPEQMPVISTLGRGFATFDHWFCEVAFADLHKPFILSCRDSVGVRNQLSPGGCLSPQHCGDDLSTAGVEGPHMAGLLRFTQPCVVHGNHPRVAIAQPFCDPLLDG